MEVTELKIILNRLITGMRFFITLFFIFLYSYSCKSQSKIKYGSIDRTLNLLQKSTEASPNDIEILFYGQSIIGGMKTNVLIDSLKKTYPTAKITFKHKPIGGFIVPKLIKTAENDIYQENPDLLIFHAYGGIHDGLYDSLVKNIRSKMSTDILLLDHHYVWDKPEARLNAINIAHERDSKGIEKIAQKYDCGYINVRQQWKNYLDENNIGVNELMGNTIDPNVHPNEKGNMLLRSIVLSELKKKPNIDYSIYNDALRERKEFSKSKKKLKTYLIGKWVQVVVDKTGNIDGKIRVLINGSPPSTFKSNYYISRSSKAFAGSTQAILKISFGEGFPKEEDWAIEIFNINRENQTFDFKLIGALTGFDGNGSSETNFISNSKIIYINKENFNIFQNEKSTKRLTPENFKIKFSVNEIAKDTIIINKKLSKYNVFRGANVVKNKIELEIISGIPVIKSLLVSKPFLYQYNE